MSMLLPIEYGKRIVGLKLSAFKDYVAARILFLNDELQQAAFYANTCLEKEFKACYYVLTTQPSTIDHNVYKLYKSLKRYDPSYVINSIHIT